MEEISTIEYTLKSNIPRIIASHIQYTMCDPMSVRFDDIIPTLWRWTYCYHMAEAAVSDYKKLLELLCDEYGPESIETKMDDYGYLIHTIQLPNSIWYLVPKDDDTYHISPYHPKSYTLISRNRQADVTASFMREFDRYIPKIHEWIENAISEKAREKLLCEITVATGKGIIEDVAREDGLTIPSIEYIRGTHKGRIFIQFTTGLELNCPLDHLRAKLVRRFKPKQKMVQ